MEYIDIISAGGDIYRISTTEHSTIRLLMGLMCAGIGGLVANYGVFRAKKHGPVIMLFGILLGVIIAIVVVNPFYETTINKVSDNRG